MKHWILTFLVIIATGLGLGYRHLWQDELETADRARTILESGYPRIIDKAGKVSFALSGIEMDEGPVHRYTPWVQFYVAAAGLEAARIFGSNKDASARAPFILAHGLTAGMISYGLSTLSSIPSPVSLSVGLIISLGTERICYNRTARYHALLDLFLVLGLVGLGGIRKNRGFGPPLLASAIFFLPQIHTMGGSILSLLLGAQLAFILLDENQPLAVSIKKGILWAVIPGGTSLIILLLLSRPWAQSAFGPAQSWSLIATYKMRKRMMYGFYFLVLCGILSFFFRDKKMAGKLFSIFGILVVASSLIDMHPFSQFRYYLSIPLLCLMWPISFGFGTMSPVGRKILMAILVMFSLIPEFTTRHFRPFTGVRLLWNDWQSERKGVRQPIHEVVDIIRKESRPQDPVLFDYTPAFANWYLPEHPLGLLPDVTTKTKLNQSNPIWKEPIQMPVWHVWYPNHGTGLISSLDKSDYRAEDLDLDKGRYLLISKALGRKEEMCIEKIYKTCRINNAPMELYKKDSFTPEGDPRDTMILARACE